MCLSHLSVGIGFGGPLGDGGPGLRVGTCVPGGSRSTLLVCWTALPVHFPRGEHHDRWYCQSAMVESCAASPRGWLCAITGKLGGRRSVVSAALRAIVHRLSTGAVTVVVSAVLPRLVDYGGKNNCAGHRSFRSQMQSSSTIQVARWGNAAVCPSLGLIVVSPAQSRPGDGLRWDGIVGVVLPVCWLQWAR